MLRSWRELRDARRKGRRDGRAGVPALEDAALPFDLHEILARAEERAHRRFPRWKQDDRVLEVEARDLEQRGVEADARVDDEEMQRDAALAEHERRVADEDERLARLQTQLESLPTDDGPAFVLEEPELEVPVSLVVPISGGAPTVPSSRTRRVPAPATPTARRTGRRSWPRASSR